MAIADVRAGNGFNGAISYDMEKDKAEHISQSGVYGTTPDEMAKEMRMGANMRNLSEPVWHVSLSLPPGEKATNEQMDTLGRTWLKEMGFDLNKAQFVIVRHKDRPHEHIHITVNRVQLDGSVVDDSFYKWRSHEACRVAEKAAGLSSFDEYTQSKGGLLHDLREAVDQAKAVAGGDLDQFKSSLEAQGLRLVEHRAKTGRMQGVSYEMPDGRIYKGSALGKAYAAAGLQRSGLDLGYEAGKPKAQEQGQSQSQGKEAAEGKAGSARLEQPGADHAAAAVQAVGGASKNEVRNMLRGRESLGLSQGQKDRLRKKQSRQNDWEM